MFKIIIISFLIQLIFGSAYAIVGGEFSEDGDLISKSTVNLNINNRSFCSGTLITNRHVLTAAHCISAGRQFQVGFGLNKDGFVNVEVESVTVHPNFSREEFKNNPSSPPNDIAVVKLKSKPLPQFKPVPLATQFVQQGDLLILAGFGLTQFFNGTSGELKFVETEVQSFEVVSKEFLFGPTPGRSACRGDSGGPAYTIDGDRLLLSGVTSRGVSGKIDSLGRAIGCSGEGFYTDVLAHKDWILESLK